MSAVAIMAIAPQNSRRTVGLMTPASPARAPIAASPTRPAMETAHGKVPAGASIEMMSGNAAPTVNVAAEVRAACTG